jgi:phage N-6-adenine-methyltransferase
MTTTTNKPRGRAPAPAQKPGRSKQTYGTPPDLIDAVERRFGRIAWDLAAADGDLAKALDFFTPEQDALRQDWTLLKGVLWLNPPFSTLAPWAAKCKVSASPDCDRTIIMLSPASVGADWYAEHVHGNAYVLPLSPRVIFLGQERPVDLEPDADWRPQGYPKDLMLTVWGGGHGPGICPWRYKP